MGEGTDTLYTHDAGLSTGAFVIIDFNLAEDTLVASISASNAAALLVSRAESETASTGDETISGGGEILMLPEGI